MLLRIDLSTEKKNIWQEQNGQINFIVWTIAKFATMSKFLESASQVDIF